MITSHGEPGVCCNLFLCNISDEETRPKEVCPKCARRWMLIAHMTCSFTEDYGSAYDSIDDHQLLVPGPEVEPLGRSKVFSTSKTFHDHPMIFHAIFHA